jgi:hypothetical protein
MRHELVAGIKSVLRPIVRHRFLIERAKFAGATILDPQAGNDRIGELLLTGKPLGVGKMGASELGGLRRYENSKDAAGHVQSWGPHWTRLHVNAGVYPADGAVFERFCKLFGETLADLDVMAVWFQHGERKLQRKFAPGAELVDLTALEPFYHDRSWSRSLAGKRVVVVTPFASTVTAQYARRAEVWKSKPDVLPDFELRTVRCPLSAALAGPKYPDWFTALDAMSAEMDAAPYDVAIVGAGAWGVPLASHARRTGHAGIHLGGPTQILFGVRGGRWDTNASLMPFYNNAWVRPSEEDRPTEFRKIENGCYW